MSDLYHGLMREGGVEPEQVSYVEIHGTNFGDGQPFEVRIVGDAFGGPRRDGLLHVGSVKGNIGDTGATAGLAGLVKVLLMMRHGRIPPQASHTGLDPGPGAFGDGKVAIPTGVVDWSPGGPRIACVNSYGTGAFYRYWAVLLREGPSRLAAAVAPVELAQYPICILANSTNSLRMYSKALLGWLAGAAATATPAALLSSLAFNLADRANHALPVCLATTATSLGDLESKLRAVAGGSKSDVVSLPGKPKPESWLKLKASPMPVVLVFGGQEGNFIGLSEDIYNSSQVFRHHIDICNDLLVSEDRPSLFPAIFQREPVDLVTLHACLFAVQYASAKAWMACGLRVSAVVGHGFGQLTATCISGAESLEDVLTLVTGPAEIVQRNWGPRPPIFKQALERLAKRFPQCTRVEASCGSSAMQHVRDCVADAQGPSQVFVSARLTGAGAQASLADATVELWKRGLAVQYWPFHRSQKARFGYLSLPPRQF